MDTVDTEALGDIGHGLHRLQRLLSSRRVFSQLASAAGVALSQQALQVLMAVGDEPRPVADIARVAHMDLGAVSRQLRVLEGERLIKRRQSPAQGSIVLVERTPSGRKLARRVDAVRQRHLTDTLGDWSPDDRRQLGRLLVRFVDDMQQTPYSSNES